MTGPSQPWIASPRCGWTPKQARTVCGELATWHMTTHDFTHQPPGDPNGRRAWMLCADCALTVLAWALQAHADGDGIYCRGCDVMLAPVLGAFVLGHGELADPESDVYFPVTP